MLILEGSERHEMLNMLQMEYVSTSAALHITAQTMNS